MMIIYEEGSTSNSKQNQENVPNETICSELLDHKHTCSMILPKDTPVELPRSSSHPSTLMLGWNNHNNTRTVDRSKVIKTLREMVKKVVMDFRLSSSSDIIEEDDDVIEAVPISFMPPQPTNFDMMTSPKKRVTTLLVGETLVSFQLPYNCPFGPQDLDMLAEEERSKITTLNMNEEFIYDGPRFTFLQRLNEWNLERRQRFNGRFDMFYHHLQSRRVFRSVAEVVNFLMYEVYPDKAVQKPAAKSKMSEDDSSERKEKWGTPLKRKFDLNVDYENPIFDLNDDHENPIFGVSDGNECQVSKEETVDKFLAEAYDNLMNSHKSKPFNFDINEKIYEEDHTEEFMAEAYNNLMNFQTDKENKKENICNVDTRQPMEEQKTTNSISNERLEHFNTKEVNGNVIFIDVDCEPSYVATTTTSGGGGGSSSAMEVAKSLQMDECDLINHIQESSDIFDLAQFLANNRGRQ